MPSEEQHLVTAAELTITVGLLRSYSPKQSEYGRGLKHALWMLSQVVSGKAVGKKGHRWLGYAQALLVQDGQLTLDGVKKINCGLTGKD